jgi:hypothetical protein
VTSLKGFSHLCDTEGFIIRLNEFLGPKIVIDASKLAIPNSLVISP